MTPGSGDGLVPSPAEAVTLDRDQILDTLGAQLAGLSSQEAERRRRRFGPNQLPAARTPHLFRLILGQISHILALMLWAAALLAFLAELPQLGWAIIAIVLINGAFSFWQEYRASQLVQALHRRVPLGARVFRDGVAHRIQANEIVPGDTVAVQRGDRVPADARLLAATDLRLDYSILTGEAEPVSGTTEALPQMPLTEATNCILAGTTVVEGTAEAVVFATGGRTVFGQVAALTERLYLETSPLQRELGRTARTIALVAVAIALIFIAIGSFTERLSSRDAFIFGLGILVALIPEGLLPTVTLSLAHGVQRMARRNAIIKRLSSVETLGCTNVICTDKTGTITINEMTAREVLCGGGEYKVSGRGYALRGTVRPANDQSEGDSSTLTWLLRCGVLCNNGIPPQEHRRRVGLGDPLDEALLVLAAKGSIDANEARRQWPRVREFPFDARRRRMSTLNRSEDRLMLFVKGGPVEVLAACARELVNGEMRKLPDERREELSRHVNSMSDRGLRVLALALRHIEGAPPADVDEAERDLIFLGVVGLDNPLRTEVPRAVERCHQAGIHVAMLTGDHAATAMVVARQAGIAGDGEEAVTGAQLDTLDDEALERYLAERQPSVFARVAPEQKLRLVQAFKGLGSVVAVTGDGVNDAPALKAADIGIAMGKRGTDVAREAADMVLLDDNFATIVAAIEEGRGVYANIRKFLTYFLTSNVAEAVPFVLFILFGIPLPLTVLQVLLVDLGTDILPGLALGVDPPEPGAMSRSPREATQRMVSPGLLLRALGFLGLLAAALSLTGYFLVQWDMTGHLLGAMIDEGPLYRQATTVTLAGIVACQIGNAFACRSERASVRSLGFFTNPTLLLAIAAEIVLLASLIGIQPLRHIFDLEPIEPRYWPLLATFPLLFLAVEEARKGISRRLLFSRQTLRSAHLE